MGKLGGMMGMCGGDYIRHEGTQGDHTVGYARGRKH